MNSALFPWDICSMSSTISVYLLDDHRVMNDGLKMMLESRPEYRVDKTFTRPEDLRYQLRFDQPDLIITDISMPETNGIELSKELLRDYPDIRILILTMHVNPELLRTAMQIGVQGYVLKDSRPEDLFDAMEAVLRGEKYISARAASALVDQGMKKTELTPRETEVLQALARGMSTREAAESLFISHHTVETHRKNLLAKSNSKNIAELIVWGVTEGYILPKSS